MHTIEMVIGDWSNDGHGMMDKYYINSSANHLELEKAYKVGVHIVGFDFSEVVCRNYEDSRIKDKHLEKLIEHGFKGELAECLEENNGYFDEDRDYVELYMFVVELGFKKYYQSELNWKFVMNNTPSINVGGYGLFYN
jgi:hypothetical protein